MGTGDWGLVGFVVRDGFRGPITTWFQARKNRNNPQSPLFCGIISGTCSAAWCLASSLAASALTCRRVWGDVAGQQPKKADPKGHHLKKGDGPFVVFTRFLRPDPCTVGRVPTNRKNRETRDERPTIRIARSTAAHADVLARHAAAADRRPAAAHRGRARRREAGRGSGRARARLRARRVIKNLEVGIQNS